MAVVVPLSLFFTKPIYLTSKVTGAGSGAFGFCIAGVLGCGFNV